MGMSRDVPYLSNSNNNCPGVAVKALHLVDVSIDFIEVVLALVQQCLLFVSRSRRSLDGCFSEKPLDGTRGDVSVKSTRIQKVLPHIGKRVIAAHDVVEALRECGKCIRVDVTESLCDTNLGGHWIY